MPSWRPSAVISSAWPILLVCATPQVQAQEPARTVRSLPDESYGSIYSAPLSDISLGWVILGTDQARDPWRWIAASSLADARGAFSSSLSAGAKIQRWERHPLRLRGVFSSIGADGGENAERIGVAADGVLHLIGETAAPRAAVAVALDYVRTRGGPARAGITALSELYLGRWTLTANVGVARLDSAGTSSPRVTDGTFGVGMKVKLATSVRVVADYAVKNDVDRVSSYSGGFEQVMMFSDGAVGRLVARVARRGTVSASYTVEF